MTALGPSRLDRPSYGLWSLWDIMKIFYPPHFIRIGVVTGLDSIGSRFPGSFSLEHASIPDKENEIALWESLAKIFVDLELGASLSTAKKISNLLTKPESTYGDLAPLRLELQGRVIDEMANRHYVALTIKEGELYSFPRKGWEEIIERFPDSVTDVEEAAKCFALSRYPASVFHSVQVVEVGLIDLGKIIEVSDPLSGWTATTNRLQNIIKKGHDARTPFERQHFSFFEQIQGTIEGLKNAWRNKISHAHGKLTVLTADFSPDVAEEILFATRAFMRRLATDAPSQEQPS
jgi:hypothetical protein